MWTPTLPETLISTMASTAHAHDGAERHVQAADLEEMVRRYPPILRQDVGELRAKMAFLTNVLKLPPIRKTWRARDGSKFQWHGVVTYPLYFTLGLATYIGARDQHGC